ncbi:MAG: SDR family oxidoreductase [Trueperaceae bacterium]
MRILSYGATGAQGEPVAAQLLAKGHAVNIIVRHPERAEHLRAKGASVFQGDLGNIGSLHAAHEGVDAVFLMLPFGGGGNPVEYAHNAINAAKQASVKFIVFNVSGQTPDTPTGMPMMDYRIAVEAALQQSGIPNVILRPTAYMENLLGPWTLPGIKQNNEVAYPVSSHRPLSWVAAQDVAKLAVAAFERPELAGSVFKVGGPEGLTGARVAQSFSNALERNITYRAISPLEFGNIMAQLMGPEAGEATTKAYEMSEAAPLEAMNIDMKSVLEKLSVELTSLEQWVKARKDLFAAELVKS